MIIKGTDLNAEDTLVKYQDILRQYNIVNQISRTVSNTLDLNRILKIILTGVTFGDGFGFNRAFLFLIDRHSTNLVGRMAIGPGSAEEAWQVWNEIQETNYSLEEFLNSEKFENQPQFSMLDEKIRHLSIPVDKTKIIWQCLEDGIPRNVDLTEYNKENEEKPVDKNIQNGGPISDIFICDPASIDHELVEYIDYPKFCIIPLICRTKKVGILIVDNKYNQREIKPDDIEFLQMLGQFASSSIRNTLIYNDLKDSISALAKLNTKLRYLKEYNEKIIESIPVSIFVVDHNFTLTMCNENCGILMGIEKDNIIGRQIDTHRVFIDGLDLMEELGRVINENKAEGFYKVNLSIDNKKPESIFDIVLVPFKFSEDTPEGALIIVEDVTNTVRLEQELNNAKKLSRLGKLSATVAHEIRNPLIAIGGYANRLKRKYSESGQTDMQSLDVIINEVSRLERIVNDILDYASNKEIKFSSVNISELLMECLILAEAAAEQNAIDIVFSCGKDIVQGQSLYVNGSRDHLKQALINIINNAIDASSKKDKISMCIYRQEENAFENIVIEINNIAPLGSKEDLTNIFLPFYTTKTKGTGLGLTITKKIIEQHSGRIEVKSSIENGTTFAIKLPLLKI
ncbi:MAG: PAS domain S-box protein [Actinobacteria bacterium]|nr:PAS domain S-box protein [Actinomycetota bacterium]